MLDRPGQPLRAAELRDPEPGPGQLLLEVRACGVCRTDLHIVDGELPHPKLPLVPGHQIVGLTEDGRRLGVPWLGWTDGDCRYCRRGRENLCDRARFTGLRPGRRLRGSRGRRRALLPPDPRRLHGRAGSAAPVRRADRLPLAAHGRGRRARRAVRVRRLGAHRRAGGAARGQARVRVHAAGRPRGDRRSPASSAPSGRAAPTGARPKSSTPRSCSPRPASSSRPRSPRSRRAGRSSAQAST